MHKRTRYMQAWRSARSPRFPAAKIRPAPTCLNEAGDFRFCAGFRLPGMMRQPRAPTAGDRKLAHDQTSPTPREGKSIQRGEDEERECQPSGPGPHCVHPLPTRDRVAPVFWRRGACPVQHRLVDRNGAQHRYANEYGQRDDAGAPNGKTRVVRTKRRNRGS